MKYVSVDCDISINDLENYLGYNILYSVLLILVRIIIGVNFLFS